MKPTIRVSIGGLAFNLEEDAYHTLNEYLNALRQHFEGNSEADEIIADIECRLSELLQMRVNDAVVSISDAQEIIKIMGNPKDFDDAASAKEEGTPTKSSNINTEDASYFKKKLFRDTDNKFIGGVCSGLSHYFRIDPTAIRLLFAGIFVLLLIVAHRGSSCMFIVLTYAILWAVMPAAKSFKQRLEMTGDDPSIENIEDRVKSSPKKYKGSIVGSAVNVFINIIVGIIAAITLIVLISIIASLMWLNIDTEIVGFTNYLTMLGYNTFNFKIAIVLFAILPAVALFSLLIKILKRSPFTTKTVISFIIGLVVWFGCLFYLANKGIGYADYYSNSKNIPVNISTDTLYIKLGEEYLNAIPQPNNPAMFYKGERKKNRQICLLPEIRIEEDTLINNYEVVVDKRGHGRNGMSVKKKSESINVEYSGSSLIINPDWYSQSKPWNLETYEIVVRVPRNKTAIIEPPLSESYNMRSIRLNFNGHDYFNNYRHFNHCCPIKKVAR